MRRQRYDCEERRRSIVEAAMPLFACQGFAGTTTKALAKAAAVSEALLYKHFPSKKALYRAILECGPATTDVAYRRLQNMIPSTETLIYFAHLAVWRHVGDEDSVAAAKMQNMQRFVINSLMGDGEFTRLHFAQIADNPGHLFEACFKKAQEAGDIITGVSARNAFWFMHHLATTLGNMHLPKESVVNYAGKKEALIRETVTFILRGFGMKESVIQAKYDPKALIRSVRADDAAAAKAA
jgi:AcrR family transcriptional regulator